MKIDELEPEMDELLKRLIPNIENELKGAKTEEIEKIEKMIKEVSGEGLPKFYRWFLLRMGTSMGSLETPGMDYSASMIISCHTNDKNKVDDEEEKFFLIGYCSEEMLPLNMYYDFEYPTRDDARVMKRASDGGDDYRQFETFREMIAWNTVLTFSVEKFPKLCKGTLYDDSGDNVFIKFDPLMKRLGFSKLSVPGGSFCAMYESHEASMVTLDLIDFDSDESDGFAFTLGGIDANCLRRILGEIAVENDLVVEVKDDPRCLGYE